MAYKMRLWKGQAYFGSGNTTAYLLENGRRVVLKTTYPTYSSSGSTGHVVGPLPFPGVKRYFEVEIITKSFTPAVRVGLTNKHRALTCTSSGDCQDTLVWSDNAGIRKGDNVQVVAVGTTGTFTAGDRIGVAFDPGTGNIWWAKNNTWIAGSNPATPTGGYQSTAPAVNDDRMNCFMPFVELHNYADSLVNHTVDVRISLTAAEMYYTPPTGFSAWDTEDLPDLVAKEIKVLNNYSVVTPPVEAVGGVFENNMPTEHIKGRYVFSGQEYIDGTVDVNGTPAGRIVRLYQKKSGVLLERMMSDASTGYFKFDNLDPTQTYFIIGHDFTLTYNGVIQDEVKQ